MLGESYFIERRPLISKARPYKTGLMSLDYIYASVVTLDQRNRCFFVYASIQVYSDSFFRGKLML